MRSRPDLEPRIATAAATDAMCTGVARTRPSSSSRSGPSASGWSARRDDAPALARADVGVAIGAGTDVAIESAGVILASDDPRGVVSVIELSRASYRKMRQNLAWAASYNVLAIPLAAGVAAPVGITLAPAVGALLMSFSTIVVALNAQLLRRLDLRPGASPSA